MRANSPSRRRFSFALLGVALIFPAPENAAGETPSTDAFVLLDSLCIKTIADPVGIGEAARLAGLKADISKPGRYFLGEPDARIVVSASSSHPAPTKAMGDISIRGCTLVVRGATPDNIARYWEWLNNRPLPLPDTAYVEEFPTALTRTKNGREISAGATELSMDDLLKVRLKQGMVRLVSVEVLVSGGMKFFYGVVTPTGAAPPSKPPPTVRPVFKPGAERYWPDEHAPIERSAVLDCDAKADGFLANCAVVFESPNGYGAAAMVLARQRQVTIQSAEVPAGENKRVRFAVHFDWPKLH